MRKIAIVFLLFATFCFADQVATTEDGKKVILKDDGTWKYAETGKPSSKTQDEYTNASEIIKTKCARDWPGDFNMRATCIEMQKDAVNELKAGKPNDIDLADYNTLHEKCRKDWPDDFNMRKTCEQMQYEALRKLRKE